MSKALLIVHGIGEQQQGQTTEKLVSGLRAAFGDRLDVRHDADGHVVAVSALGVTVEFCEVYWADLLTREANLGAFTWSTLPTLVWHPLLCRRAGLLSSGEYRSSLVLAWLALTLPASLLAYPIAQGARVFVQPFDKERRNRLRARMKGLPFMQRAGAAADAAAHGETVVEATLEGVVADVPNYMGSVVRGEGVAFDVLERFHRVMRDVGERHDEVYILAHSLGTVVAYHALTGVGQPPVIRRTHRAGSSQSAARSRRFASSGRGPFALRRRQHIPGSGGRTSITGWTWSPKSLRRFATWSPLDNVRLKSGGGILRSHVVYERSPEFLGMLTEELFGERTVPDVPWLRRVWDRAITAGENLAAPLGLIASLAMGLGAIVIVMLILPFAMSSVLRLFGADAWAVRVGNRLSLLAVFVLTLFVVRLLRQCYRTACASVALGTRRTSETTDSGTLGV